MRPTPVTLGWLGVLLISATYVIVFTQRQRDALLEGKAFLDLRVYRDAVLEWRSGAELYEVIVTEVSLPFMYPPIAALFFYPLAITPLEFVQWGWLVANLLSYVVVVCLSFRFMKPALSTLGRCLVASVMMFLLWPLWLNNGFGQINVFMMLLVTLDWMALRRARGAFIGLAASVKVAPGFFLLLYAMHRKWREVAYGLGVIASVGLLTLMVARQETLEFFLGVMWDPNKSGEPSYATNQSLRGGLSRWGIESTSIWIVLAFVVLLVGMTALYRSRHAHPVLQLFIVALTGLLVSPISWGHHWVWGALIPAVLVYLWRSRFWVPFAAILPLLLVLMLWDIQGFHEVWDWTEMGWFDRAVVSNPYMIAASFWLLVMALAMPRDIGRQQKQWTAESHWLSVPPRKESDLK